MSALDYPEPTMTLDEAVDAGHRVAAWRLFHVHVYDATVPLTDALRPFIFFARMSAHVILHDPLLRPGENWLRICETGRDDVPLYLSAQMDTKPPTARIYLPADAGGGFRAEKPLYEGHWRATPDEHSELPWPSPEPSWTERTSFLQKLAEVEPTAYRVEYRGYSRCRLCGQENGRDGLRVDRWEWPAGYRHYIDDHDVRPSPQFEQFIRQR